MKAPLLLTLTLLTFALSSLEAQDDFDLLRQRFVTLITGGPEFTSGDPRAEDKVQAIVRRVVSNGKSRDRKGTGFWDTMDDGGGVYKNRLWSEVGRLSANYRNVELSLERLNMMALAYALPSSALFKNPELAKDILWAINFCFEQNYNERIEHKSYENWFALELGIPLKLLPTLALMYDTLPPTQLNYFLSVVNKFSPYPDKVGGHHQPATGANLAWKARVVAMSAILGKDPERLTAAAQAIGPIFDNTTTGDGWYDDGSFVQHRYYSYTGGYGMGAIGEPLLMAQMLEGSKWKMEPAKIRVLLDRLELGYAPLVVDGEMMDMVRGREIARDEATSIDAGNSMIRIYARAYDVAPDAMKPLIAGRIKRWMKAGAYAGVEPEKARFLHDDLLVREINESSISASEPPRSHHVFAAMDRVVHRAGDWSAGLALYSSRIAPYEAINGENRRGWHTSSGHLAIYNGDLRQFVDGFWPTVDSHRLPGTTVVSGSEPKGERSKKGFVGGVVGPDGKSGMSVMHLQVEPNAEPTAQKAWAFFENAIVCLGAGITSPSGRVETIIENRKIQADGSTLLTTTPTSSPLKLQQAPGTPLTLKTISSAHLAGTAGEPGIGYIFPQTADLQALKESRTDSWKSINTTSLLPISEEPVTNAFLTLWIDHGEAPREGAYAYILLPRASAAETSAFAKQPGIQIVKNSTQLQALNARGGRWLGAAFWEKQGGEFESNGLRVGVDGPGLVIVEKAGEGFQIALCDPSQKLTETLTLTLSGRFSKIEKGDAALKLGSSGEIRFDPRGLRGRTATATLR